jgi:ATP-binding cassette subfamily F protein 3
MSGTILRLDEVDFYFSKERYIFKNVDISATMDSRICIVGENGAGKKVIFFYFWLNFSFHVYVSKGKTTLLKVLIGELEPVKGIRHTHRSLRLGYFTQHHVDALNMNMNSVELLQAKFPRTKFNFLFFPIRTLGLHLNFKERPIEEYRAELGKFGVSGDMALQPIVSLSGGQKSRVAFAMLSMIRRVIQLDFKFILSII